MAATRYFDAYKACVDIFLDFERESERVDGLTQHQGSRGEARESMIRERLAMQLPMAEITSGHILRGDSISPQMDILVLDRAKPVRDRVGDTVRATPAAVRAFIECKISAASTRDLKEAVEQVAEQVKYVNRERTMVGLFVQAGPIQGSRALFNRSKTLLEIVERVSREAGYPVLDVASIGAHLFLRRWDNAKIQVLGEVDGPAWHTYAMQNTAPGYLIHNVVDHVGGIDDDEVETWFPIAGGKETTKLHYVAIGGQVQKFKNPRRAEFVY